MTNGFFVSASSVGRVSPSGVTRHDVLGMSGIVRVTVSDYTALTRPTNCKYDERTLRVRQLPAVRVGRDKRSALRRVGPMEPELVGHVGLRYANPSYKTDCATAGYILPNFFEVYLRKPGWPFGRNPT